MAHRLGLASGIVMLLFVLGHFLNHMLGLVSLEAMNWGLQYSIAPWRNIPGLVLLGGALTVHLCLALKSLYGRRSLRMTTWEAFQLALGLIIPVLLMEHVIGTRAADDLTRLRSDYTYVMAYLWVAVPWLAATQIALVVVAWVHAMIGLHYWLRLKRWYPRLVAWLFAVAVLLPALAVAGFVSTGLDVRARAADPGYLDGVFHRARLDAAEETFIRTGTQYGLMIYALLLGGTLAARGVRLYHANRRSVPRLIHPSRAVPLRLGATVLETLRDAGIAHASVCGGRGRCSTCRVQVHRGGDRLVDPTPEELRVLKRIGAPPGVRLACQIRPPGDLEIVPLLPPTATARDGFASPAYKYGEERTIAILFADLRGFTKLSDSKLPFDVVFLLNRYFDGMGHAVEQAGGHLDKFIGDGVMALFGVESGPQAGCRQALAAAGAMARELAALNRSLAGDLPEPLRMGIGIHVGPAIVGEMGYGRAKALTAIGDAVNTASRLEGLSKEFAVELVVSDEVIGFAGLDLDAFPPHQAAIRGKREKLTVRAIPAAAELAPLLA
ncbi:MAG: adenylate/guanylate cyclase domain-containing protein [Rhodospirillaceae bacterium]|nr:adenylate/guanylate cyclase domain-containing protein [Rhodospirillaceae bacterium]